MMQYIQATIIMDVHSISRPRSASHDTHNTCERGRGHAVCPLASYGRAPRTTYLCASEPSIISDSAATVHLRS